MELIYFSFFLLFLIYFFSSLLLLLLLFTGFRVFHTSISRWLLTRVWVTANFLESPGLFAVFWLYNAVVWMVFTRPLIPKSPSPCTNPLVTVLRAPITIGIPVTFMFTFFKFSWKVEVLIFFFFSLSFNFTLWSAERAKSTIRQVIFSFFFFLFFFFFFY